MTSQNPTRKQLLPYPPSRPSPQKVTNKDKTNDFKKWWKSLHRKWRPTAKFKNHVNFWKTQNTILCSIQYRTDQNRNVNESFKTIFYNRTVLY